MLRIQRIRVFAGVAAFIQHYVTEAEPPSVKFSLANIHNISYLLALESGLPKSSLIWSDNQSQ